VKGRHASVRLAIAAAATILLASGCATSASRARGSADVLRLGVFPTLTHAVAHVGIRSGIFERDLAPTRLQVTALNSGTEAGIALLSGSIDAAYIGAWPTASLFERSGKVRVVAGAAEGGVSLVVRRGAGISAPADLHGKRIAVPNLGNSQDVALRTWLHQHDLRATDEGGDVSITECDTPQLLQLFRADRLDGAWVPEPYPTQLVDAGVADPLVDEADLWPRGGFLTANLVVSSIYMDAHPDVVGRLVRANVDAIRSIRSDPQAAMTMAARELTALGASDLPPDVVERAWAKITFTWDPIPEAMVRVSEDAFALGLLPSRPTDILGIYELDALDEVLNDEGLPPVQAPG
jgi:NitT/TauT family transport system substrate-binding protein